MNEEELGRRVLVFASKTSILTEPSEMDSLLGAVDGYAEATRRIGQLFTEIEPTLENQKFSQQDAREVLTTIATVADDGVIAKLANDVRQAEINARDDVLQRLSRRMVWTWAGFALCWLVLALWLLYAVRSRRLYQFAASDRQRAIEGIERAVAAKRKFLNMVSHEVRSPLQSIVSAAELLALQNLRAESAGAIHRIRLAVVALQGQLRDLLTIARDDSGEWAMQSETFDVCELVRDVCAELADTAQAKSVRFTVDAPSTPVVRLADPIRMAQVLRNVVENAVRYTDQGGVTVRLQCDEPEHSATGEASPLWVRFSVEDTGPGLSSQVLQRLKDAPIPSEVGNDGSGIGLFVIREVLHQLGGRVEVCRIGSVSGLVERTLVTVDIPVQSVSEPTPASDTSDAKAHADSPLHVLIVDDRPDVLASLSEMTRRLGHACSVSTSADHAAVLMDSTHFDTVLIDLEMPGKNGRVLASEIRQGSGSNAGSMLILISAAENRQIGFDWPFDGFLQKPIDGQALKRLIGSRTPR